LRWQRQRRTSKLVVVRGKAWQVSVREPSEIGGSLTATPSIRPDLGAFAMRSGHLPGHIRDTFLEATWSFHEWAMSDCSEPPGTVTRENRYKPQQISVAAACGLQRPTRNEVDALDPGPYPIYFDAAKRDAIRRSGVHVDAVCQSTE